MAPKASPDVRSLQRSLQALTQQVASLSKGSAKGKGNNWSCSACAEETNYPHRTTCFRCGAPKSTGNRTAGPRASGTAGTRAKSRTATVQPSEEVTRKGPLVATAPDAVDSSQAGSQPDAAEQDPVAVELAVAKSLHLWALRLKEPAKGTELPKAEKRLADAQAAHQERRPPGERLRAALSRVEAKERRLEEAKAVAAQAQAALDAAKGEEKTAEEQLEEAEQELTQAQAAHVEHTRSATASHAPVGMDGRPYLDALLTKLAPGSEQSDLLIKFLATAKAPGVPPAPWPAATDARVPAAETGGGLPTPNPPSPPRQAARRVPGRNRSRSRSREGEGTTEAGTADDAMDAAGLGGA